MWGQCYGDYYDNIPNYFDYDDPDHGGLLDDNDDYDDDGPLRLSDFDEPDDYELYHDLHGQDGCGVYCISRGNVGVVPYWSDEEEGDVYEGDPALACPVPDRFRRAGRYVETYCY